MTDKRADWLKRRKEFLTASDCAAVLGVDPRRGPLAVYLDKTTDKVSDHDNAWMRWGRDVEGAICSGYEYETGRDARDLGAHEIQVHPDIPWLGATLDRYTEGSDEHPPPEVPPRILAGDPVVAVSGGPLEAKAVAGMKAPEWKDTQPTHYQVQLQIQMACTGASWGSLVALIGGVQLIWKDLVRDDSFLDAALPVLEEFWVRVQKKDPPPADGLTGTTETLKRMYPDDDGTTIVLPKGSFDLAEHLDETKRALKEVTAQKNEIENELRSRMGEHTFGALGDGTLLTLKTTTRDGYTVKPTQYRALRRQRPKLPRGKK